MNWPQPFWAVLLALLGSIIALACLFAPTPQNIVLAVLAVASNLVSGALGAFAGHAASNSKTDIATGSGPITVNPSVPKP